MGAVRVKSATGAHIGTGTWLVQRATAVVLAVALPGLIIHFLAALPVDFPSWQALFAPLWVRVLLLLTMTGLALHAWVGMRDMFMDYVRSTGMRLALYLVVIVTLAGCEIVMLMVLWK
jgi:succinate dehydrogenase / fumarate reductase membrane anchor subunit